MMPLRPVDGHGQRFHTTQHLMIVSWLQDEGFKIVLDQVDRVELALEDELIRIASDGSITPFGDRAARRLLLHSEEHTP